ncbi:Meiotically up-regulated gene 89 protein [Talaromyces islandicus]|uniref:Meiotically up-regulated gene 89 protein n=1 Tax=Talaromyces islandicus TaxID=28573 RepID=A0A0U1LTF9_TALIS|nr:Meiotically up-regulated gene 89 protein [Talaromyces islandicus]
MSQADTHGDPDHLGPDDGEKKKSKRPANTAFRQQRLKAWQPILTPKSVLPLFFVIGAIFAPLGGVLLWASEQVQEIVIDYTGCPTQAPTGVSEPLPEGRVSSTFKSLQPSTFTWSRNETNTTTLTTPCSLYFQLPEPIGPPVFLYYKLTNFYQNHRKYVQSLDNDQLKGVAVSNDTIKSGNCDPLQVDKESNKAYYPCGLIANSIFNDTIHSPVPLSGNSSSYNMTGKGIAWSSDKELIKTTKYKYWEVVPPPNWRRKYGDSYTAETLPDLHNDEAFMVWMRTAGLPTFSKLSLRNDDDVMPSGSYRLDIDDSFNVTEYGGTKSILISTRTVMGGRNSFMGIAYVVVGGICVLMGVLFAVAHLQQGGQREVFVRDGICGTETPSTALKDAHKRLASTKDSQRVANTDDGKKPKNIEVETYFHVVSTTDNVNLVTNEMIASQFVFLERAYANASIKYRLLGIDRSINDTWAQNGDDKEMKRALRRGNYSSLNVYFQTDLRLVEGTSVNSRATATETKHKAMIPRASPSPNLLGFCTLPNPKINASSPVEDYIDDGCNILAATMPGGSIPHYNRGGTTVHEVGHWHGLLHVFQGDSCSPSNEGDYIADTPQQSIATEGCPTSQDSCPDSPGLDSIHNFMDYSSDDCYQGFTNDQGGRMRSMWSTMREGK